MASTAKSKAIRTSFVLVVRPAGRSVPHRRKIGHFVPPTTRGFRCAAPENSDPASDTGPTADQKSLLL
jgi:hypothetical protein